MSLGTRLSSLDAGRFVGRSAELARLAPLLEADRQASVVLLHGPGGVGKSALSREFARRAAEQGWTPFPVEARDLAPLGEALDEALAPALSVARPLVMLESWDRLAALDSYLRDNILSRLPPDALAVIVTRRPPGSGWHSGGWEHVVMELRLGPLGTGEADALLAVRGVSDMGARAATVSWARGSPLALVLAAEAGGVPHGTADAGPLGVADKLLHRLLDAQPEGEQRSLLAVAALARVTSRGLLAQVLPAVDASAAYAWLCRHPSAEPLRDGIMLHELVGRVLRADLRRRSPELERDLRRRLVDALYADAATEGLLRLTLDLQHLVQDPAIRWGFAWDASGRYWIDSPGAGDADAIAAQSGRSGLAWLESAEPYFRDAPNLVTVVRDRDGAVAGYGVSMTAANAPSWSADDDMVGQKLRHASAHFPDGAVVCRQAIDLTREEFSPVTALIGMAAIIGSGLDNPAAAYLPIRRGDALAEAFSASCGGRSIPELAVEHGGVCVDCHVLDYGPGGLLAFQRAAVYRELGLPVPPPLPAPQPQPWPPTLQAVRDVLRYYGSPTRLAASPMAPRDGTPAERAAAVRAQVDEAVRIAFGAAREDQVLRQVLTRGYLDPAPTHEQAAAELSLSRTSYFRYLRVAVRRVAAELGVRPAGTNAEPRRH